MKWMIVTCAAAVLAMAGCAGSSQAPPAASLAYSNAVAPRHSYTPYETRSHNHLWGLARDTTEVYIGGDLEPRESLRRVWVWYGKSKSLI